MRLARFWRTLALVALPAVLGLGASGCHTYKYYDMHLTFDPMGTAAMPGFNKATAYSVFVCQVIVTGADSANFDLPHADTLSGNAPANQHCPDRSPSADPLEAGMIEFSTFADSGNLTFTLNAYQNPSRTPDCLIGIGTVTLPVTSMITTVADLPIKKQANTCVDTGQHQGDASALPD